MSAPARFIFGISLAFLLVAPTLVAAQSAPPSSTQPQVSSVPSSTAKVEVLYTRGNVLQVQRDSGENHRTMQTVRVRLVDSGGSLDLGGKDFTVLVPLDGPTGLPIEPGDTVTVRIDRVPNGNTTTTILEQSHGGMWIILFLAALLLLLIGRRSGFFTLITLLLVAALVLFLTAPLILRGMSPVWAAIMTYAAFSVAASLLIYGWTRATVASVASAVLALIPCTAIGWSVLAIANLERYRALSFDALRALPGISTDTLPLAITILVSCGAVIHVVARITSSIFLEHQQHPDRGLAPLLDAGLTHGRRILPSIAETALWSILGLGLPQILLGATQVSVFRIIQRGEVDFILILPLVLLGTVACAIPITTVTAGVLAAGDRHV